MSFEGVQARERTVRLVRLGVAASLLVPCLVFAFASWASFRSLLELTDERLIRSLDVQEEHALKAFEVVGLVLNNATELVAGMSQPQLRDDEARLHLEFKKLVGALPIVQSAWIYDREGRALVSSWVHPPPAQSFADRDFFAAHVNGGTGLYYGQVYASVFGAQPFFTVSR